MTTAQAASTWAPLRSPVFRALWIAQLVSNLGTWMQTVGAQWMLVGDPRAAVLVPLVQTATTLPVMLLALPSGVLADLIDRRRLLIATQGAMAATVAALASLTGAGLTTPTVLLLLLFVIGCGQALTMPAWQAIQPDLVRDLAQLIPITHSLEGMRLALLEGASFRAVSHELLILTAFAIVLLPASLLFFSWTLRRARIDGTLSFY